MTIRRTTSGRLVKDRFPRQLTKTRQRNGVRRTIPGEQADEPLRKQGSLRAQQIGNVLETSAFPAKAAVDCQQPAEDPKTYVVRGKVQVAGKKADDVFDLASNYSMYATLFRDVRGCDFKPLPGGEEAEVIQKMNLHMLRFMSFPVDMHLHVKIDKQNRTLHTELQQANNAMKMARTTLKVEENAEGGCGVVIEQHCHPTFKPPPPFGGKMKNILNSTIEQMLTEIQQGASKYIDR